MIFLFMVLLFFLIMSRFLPTYARPYGFILDPINDRIKYVYHKVVGTDDIDLPSSVYKQKI